MCQSVFKSLFVGLKEGRFELNRPDQLERLLRVMSRFKIASEGRRLSVILREVIDGYSPPDQTDSGPSPEKPIDDQDLAENVVKHFMDDELELLRRRLDGESWPSIAAQQGVSAESCEEARAGNRAHQEHSVAKGDHHWLSLFGPQGAANGLNSCYSVLPENRPVTAFAGTRYRELLKPYRILRFLRFLLFQGETNAMQLLFARTSGSPVPLNVLLGPLFKAR